MIRRIFIPGCVLLLSIALIVAGAPTRAQGSIPDAIVGSPILTLHVAPNQYSAGIAVLQNGTRMRVDGRDATSRWLHVITEDNQIGWLSRPFLILRNDLIIDNLPVMDGTAPTSGGGGSGGNPTSAPGAPTPTPAATPTSQAGKVPAPIVRGHVGGGFALGGQVQSLGAGTLNAMHTAGMTWVKFQVQAGDGGANGLIDQVHGLGFRILLSVVGDRGSVTNDGYQSSYAGYVGGLAGHGADAIEIWNEMNIDREWPTGQINPALYVRLLAKAYNAIKSNNSGTMVITGALAPTGAEGAFGLDRVWNDDHYYAGMAAAGAGSYADCIGVHYNEGIVSPYQSGGDPRDNYPTRYFITMLYRATRPFGMPACFTELGYLSPEGYGGLPGSFGWAQNTTVAQQASWLAGAAVRAWGSGRVRLMIVFNVDFTGYGADPQAGYAMIRPGGGCPACDALGRVTH